MLYKKNDAVCGATYINEKEVKKSLPTNERLINTAEILKVLGDPTRLKIVMALAKTKLCVCDLSALFGISISGISNQLRLLRGNRLVTYRREGKMAYYSLDDEHVGQIIIEVFNHVKVSYK